MVFTVNEEKRIVCLFAIYETPTEVRRRYINEYYIAPRVASTLQLTQFIRVWKRFQERGGTRTQLAWDKVQRQNYK